MIMSRFQEHLAIVGHRAVKWRFFRNLPFTLTRLRSLSLPGKDQILFFMGLRTFICKVLNNLVNACIGIRTFIALIDLLHNSLILSQIWICEIIVVSMSINSTVSEHLTFTHVIAGDLERQERVVLTF